MFRICSGYVQSMSEYVQSMFRVCSILKSFHHLAHPVCQFLDLFICVPICACYVFILCKISEILMFVLQWSDNACFCRKQLRLSVQFDWRLSGRLYTIFNILILTIMVSIYSTCTWTLSDHSPHFVLCYCFGDSRELALVQFSYLGLCKISSLNIYRISYLCLCKTSESHICTYLQICKISCLQLCRISYLHSCRKSKSLALIIGSGTVWSGAPYFLRARGRYFDSTSFITNTIRAMFLHTRRRQLIEHH